ncbi:GGDEF domain-containing protein [Rhodospirillum sp. A1_3_36]|uniref:GGDEF domain-containing protein n=1 Tax=Rhodospirillum sp. A1_3_36 TaxID=3391666 RepID=UPI0039A5CADB
MLTYITGRHTRVVLSLALIALSMTAIYFNNLVLGKTRQQMEAYPTELIIDSHNTYSQTNTFLIKLHIHLKDPSLYSREDILHELDILTNRWKLLTSITKRTPYTDGTLKNVLRESHILRDQLKNVQSILSGNEKFSKQTIEELEKDLTTIDDQSVYLRTVTENTVYKENAAQGRLLSHYAHTVSWAIGIVTALLIIALFLLASLARQRAQLNALSRTDALTGLGNRRAFDEQMTLFLEINRRQSLPLQMLLLDVDYFKKYNDTYGHIKGDEALIAIGAALGASLKRKGDGFFRIGGEEFVCLFQCSDQKAAVALADEILQNVRNLAIVHEKNPPHGIITVSGGLVHLDRKSDVDADKIRQAADFALYQAKERGRDQIVLSDHIHPPS